MILAGLWVWQTLAGIAHAADSTEFWPQVSGFVNLSPRTRIFLDSAYAEGKESDSKSLDLAAYLDISLKPIARKQFLDEDWQRSRYLWARIGYARIFKVTDGADAEVAEDRGIVALHWKVALPAEVWLEARVRTDFRWIDGDYSNRHRFRVEATREFTLFNRTVVPYFNVELFYDTRYDGWARTLYQLGPEITVNKHFRYEIYVARQVDRLPSSSSLNAIGVVAKWYN